MSDLADQLREAIENVIPDEEECLADEEACWKRHPIHETCRSHGRIVTIEADLDDLIDLLVRIVEGR
jgi:hypothetical protein